jgi:hypothetical protein
VWKAYALGFFSAAMAVLLVSVIWFGTGTSDEPGLLWGDKVYSSKYDFGDYLKTKGLSYKTWAARHPDGAPWEPSTITIGAITLRASTETREAWVVRLPLAAIGLMAATGATLLLLRGLRSARPKLASRPVAFLSAVVSVLLVAAERLPVFNVATSRAARFYRFRAWLLLMLRAESAIMLVTTAARERSVDV